MNFNLYSRFSIVSLDYSNPIILTLAWHQVLNLSTKLLHYFPTNHSFHHFKFPLDFSKRSQESRLSSSSYLMASLSPHFLNYSHRLVHSYLDSHVLFLRQFFQAYPINLHFHLRDHKHYFLNQGLKFMTLLQNSSLNFNPNLRQGAVLDPLLLTFYLGLIIPLVSNLSFVHLLRLGQTHRLRHLLVILSR